LKFQDDIKIKPKEDFHYNDFSAESFMHKMLSKFNKNYFDLDAFSDAFYSVIFSTKKRINNFALEKKILMLFKNFLNRYNSEIYQTDLKDNDEFQKILKEKNDKNQQLIEERSDFQRKIANGLKNEEVIRRILREMKEKDPGAFEKIKKKSEDIKKIPNKFNFWKYAKKNLKK